MAVCGPALGRHKALRRSAFGQHKALVISNLFHVLFSPKLAPKPNLIKIGSKKPKLNRFATGRLW